MCKGIGGTIMNYTKSVENGAFSSFAPREPPLATLSWNAVSLRYLKAIPSAKP